MTKLPLPLACVPLAALLTTGCPSDDPSTTSADDSSTSDPTTSGDPTTMTPTTTMGDSSTSADSSTGNPTGPTGTDDTSTESTGTEDTTSTTDTGEDESSSSTTGAVCELLQCGDACIDPDTDPNFCGATGDCMGENAGVACSASATCAAAACVETCDNCSFETGDFTGWTTQDLMSPYLPLTVAASGDEFENFFGMATATDGTSLALSGFDGDGADSPENTIEIGQDITLRADAPADLLFDYRLAWDMLNLAPSMLDRTFEVRIEPEGGGDPLEVVLVETAAAMTVGDTVVADYTVDLGAYAGDTVYINFVLTVPENYTGPGRAELDNVRVVAQ